MIPYIFVEKINTVKKLLDKNIENIEIELENILEEQIDTIECESEGESEVSKNSKKITRIYEKMYLRLLELNQMGCYTFQYQPFIETEHLIQRSYNISLIKKTDFEYFKQNLEFISIDSDIYFSINKFDYRYEYIDNRYEYTNMDEDYLVLEHKNGQNRIFENPFLRDKTDKRDKKTKSFLDFLRENYMEYENICTKNLMNELTRDYLILFTTTKKLSKQRHSVEKILLHLFKHKPSDECNWLNTWIIFSIVFYSVGLGIFFYKLMN